MRNETHTLEDLIPVETIQERDIDLLLLEELSCSDSFREWFLTNTVGNKDILGLFKGCWHSVCHPKHGESDLVLMFTGKDGRGYLLLVENKIAAGFQPNQSKRYHLRGDEFINAGECTDYSTILIAPSNYISDSEDFDFYLAYEDIKSWFEEESGLGKRGSYKAHLLECAIDRLRRGYRPIRDENTTKFWHRYWECVTDSAPELKMREARNDIPRQSVWFSFKPKAFPQGISILHKANRGVIDLQLSGKGDRIEELQRDLDPFLGLGMTVEKTAKSAAVRIQVPLLDLQQDFGAQEDAVREGVAGALRLYRWALENIDRMSG